MGKKRKGRECALQILYQVELGGQLNLENPPPNEPENLLSIRPLQNISSDQLDQMIGSFFEHFSAVPEIPDFAKTLVHGVVENIQNIDRTITENSPKWKIGRMPHVDRNTLRLCAFELLYQKTPHRVVIDGGSKLPKGSAAMRVRSSSTVF